MCGDREKEADVDVGGGVDAATQRIEAAPTIDAATEEDSRGTGVTGGIFLSAAEGRRAAERPSTNVAEGRRAGR